MSSVSVHHSVATLHLSVVFHWVAVALKVFKANSAFKEKNVSMQVIIKIPLLFLLD